MPQHRMLINYVPGDECRVAITRDGLLEELYAERLNAVGHVGNIYVGKVVNVESSIQAAFIDFGLEQNGFLHITDLHPRYFPGEDDDATESVGKKTPRRERPPIQHALKRGQEIIVQVIKEGIGTKGPTLTSYLSIPGRFLVMMPDMERVGVSRKVEDDELRREARRVLDDVELPKGFGFILRTAGIGKTKTEIKRDLAYLQRLWKDMERRRKGGKKPRLLYTESDLLVRSLRDVLTAEIDEIVIDDVHAIARASRFLKIVAPRSSTRLLHYEGAAPMFHSFGIEEQIQAIHKREAPLPSGGRLVIDETEALVAIDVNSGRMRASNDAETSAFRTNMEAADEICRQIRLRDLGGLLVLDLIDMRSRSHRREVENKFKALFKRDRARTKLLPISDLGLLELTRQRMRGSLRSAHFAECRTCVGTGVVQRPESVASDSLRELKRILLHDQVKRVDLVVPARVAGEMLSSKRAMLARIERDTAKPVDVRVSETLAADKVVFYAYDDRGADVDIDRLPKPKAPKDLPVYDDGSSPGEQWAVDPGEEAAAIAAEEAQKEADREAQDAADSADDQPAIDEDHEPLDADEGAGGKKKRRRRRRRRGGKGRSEGEQIGAPGRDASESDDDDRAEPGDGAPVAGKDAEPSAGGEEGGGRKRRRRRRRRGGRGRGRAEGAEPQADGVEHAGEPEDNGDADGASASQDDAPSAEGEHAEEGAAPKKKRRRRRGGRGRGKAGANGEAGASDGAQERADEAPDEPTDTAPPPAEETLGADGEPTAKKTRSRRGGRKKTAAKAEAETGDAPDDAPEADAKPVKKKTTRKKTAKKATKKASSRKKPASKKKSTKKKTTKASSDAADTGADEA
ncbi:MAG: Rne/Rng family ribonuclease [Phycisphaerales bacterium]